MVTVVSLGHMALMIRQIKQNFSDDFEQSERNWMWEKDQRSQLNNCVSVRTRNNARQRGLAHQ